MFSLVAKVHFTTVFLQFTAFLNNANTIAFYSCIYQFTEFSVILTAFSFLDFYSFLNFELYSFIKMLFAAANKSRHGIIF